MKFKSLLLAVSACAMAHGATAQSHHGFYWKVESFDLDPYVTNNSNADKSLTCWFTPEVVMPMVKNDATLEESTVYSNNSSTMLVRLSTINGTKNNYFTKVTGTALNTNEDYYKFDDDGMLVCTMPDKMDYPRTDAETPNWTAAPATGCMLFHLTLGGAPARINDAGNALSATLEEAYLSDCTGMYVGIKAPAGCTIKSFLSTSSISKANMQADLSLNSGTVYNANLEGKVHTAAFDYDAVCDGEYHEFTSGAAYNALTGLTYVSTKWPNGYCVKYVDVVVYGVKPGDVVGFAGVQTLHSGWTGQEFIEGGSAGVDAVGVDNADAPVEYFNLQGMSVNADNLTPGIYIKRKGTETSKIVIK